MLFFTVDYIKRNDVFPLKHDKGSHQKCYLLIDVDGTLIVFVYLFAFFFSKYPGLSSTFPKQLVSKDPLY